MAGALQANEVDCNKDSNTYQMNECAKQKMATADNQLELYFTKAKQKYKQDPKLVDKLVLEQQAWITYRKAHCDAVSQKWAGGTIAGVIYGKCIISMTKERTHLIWESYLTSMDSTPALLAEPK